MKCRKCGTNVTQSAKFCTSCGTSVSFDLTEVNFTHKGRASFTTAVKLGFSRTFDYKGRSSRAEFWWFNLFMFLSAFGITLLVALIGASDDTAVGIGYLYLLILLPSYIALTVRRLHDTNRSGFWYLLGFVPFGSLFLLYWLVEGDKEPNKYGALPSLFET